MTSESGRADSNASASGTSDSLRQPMFSVEDVMRRVRTEIARRQGDHSAATRIEQSHSYGKRLPRWRSAAEPLPARDSYSLAELTAFSDAEFVDAAYRALLHRPPDPPGGEYWLRALRSGVLSKVEVLAALCRSDEGMSKSARVEGLMWRYLIRRARRLPVVGPLIAWIVAFLRLPTLQGRLELIEVLRANESQTLGRQINALAGEVEGELSGVSARMREQERLIAERVAQDVEHVAELARLRAEFQADMKDVRGKIDEEASKLTARFTDLAGKERTELHRDCTALRVEFDEGLKDVRGKIDKEVSNLTARFTDMVAKERMELRNDWAELRDLVARKVDGEFVAALRNEVDGLHAVISDKADISRVAGLSEQMAKQHLASVGLQRRFSLLVDEVRRWSLPPIDSSQISPAIHEAHRLDEMYADFEARFRGSVEDVRRRAEDYVNVVVDAGAGTFAAPVVDLGCGRGEWLDLLAERGLFCRGVDLNRVFLAACRARGLDVVESDVLTYLRELPDASIGAISSMHVVEHLPMETLIDVLDESLRVLVPGGVIILETPNPENLLVGAHYFYLDPTHRNPLPPALLQWLVEARGFIDTRIERLMQHRGAPPTEPVSDDVPGARQINLFVSLVNQSLDYAVVARKRAESPV